MGQEEINQAQEQLARLFGNYMEQVFEDNKNKNLKFTDLIANLADSCLNSSVYSFVFFFFICYSKT